MFGAYLLTRAILPCNSCLRLLSNEFENRVLHQRVLEGVDGARTSEDADAALSFLVEQGMVVVEGT